LAATWISKALPGTSSAESWFEAAHQKMKRNRNKVDIVQPISTSQPRRSGNGPRHAFDPVDNAG
jgi:hypothetical protein